MSTLVLDVGNSRTKWGLTRAAAGSRVGVTPNAEIGTLALREWQNLPRPVRIVGVNVAGEPARMRIEAQLARWRVPPEWLLATATGRRRRQPLRQARAARRRPLGGAGGGAAAPARREELFPPPVVVVNAGTAVTIDALDSDGVFRGGVILPGLRLMLQALAENTSALKHAAGHATRTFPPTPDALYSGAMQAICGAIERDARAHRREDVAVQVLRSPAAPRTRSRRTLPARSRSWIIWCLKACWRWPRTADSGATRRPSMRTLVVLLLLANLTLFGFTRGSTARAAAKPRGWSSRCSRTRSGC